MDVLNSITDGFTLQVLAPDNNGANTADIMIYGKTDGQYKKIRSGYTSDLGYLRVKGLAQSQDGYVLFIKGSFQNDQGTHYYLYKEDISGAQLGQKITINGANVKEVEFSMRGDDGQALENPYLKLLR